MADSWFSQESQPKKKRIWPAARWLAFFLLVGGVGWFTYKIWFYAEMMRHGELIQLPQYEQQISRLASPKGLSGQVVDRALVETDDNPTLGDSAAPKLVIVEFGDFECDFSSQAATVARTVMARFGDRVRFVYRDYPLGEIHPLAYQAALAAECAREQGKFWIYHDKLYGHEGNLTIDLFTAFAREAGLDERQFERCLADERYRSQVEADLRDGGIAGLRGTPTFFFNGQRVEGQIPEDVFVRIVEKMLE